MGRKLVICVAMKASCGWISVSCQARLPLGNPRQERAWEALFALGM